MSVILTNGPKTWEAMLCKPCDQHRDDIQKKPFTRTQVYGAWSAHAAREVHSAGTDVLQPVNKDGTINKHFIQTYGTQRLAKETKIPSSILKREAEKPTMRASELANKHR